MFIIKTHEQHHKYSFSWFSAEPPSQRASDETHFFNTNRALLSFGFRFSVNDSEYSKSTGAKPILSCGFIYLVSPGALLLLWQLRIFAAAAAGRPYFPALLRKSMGSKLPIFFTRFVSAAAALPSAARIFPALGLLLLYQKNKTSSDVDTSICVCTRKATVSTEDSCAGTQPQNLVGKGRH